MLSKHLNMGKRSSSSSQSGEKRNKKTNGDDIVSELLSLEISPANAHVQFTYAEDSLSLWIHSDDFAWLNLLFDRRFGDDKFPTALLSSVECRMKDLVGRVNPNEQGKPPLNSLFPKRTTFWMRHGESTQKLQGHVIFIFACTKRSEGIFPHVFSEILELRRPSRMLTVNQHHGCDQIILFYWRGFSFF